MYTVKAVADLTGLSPETLRAWERRHGVVAPVRDASGRRTYDQAAVDRLARLKRLTDHGHAIRRLAALDDVALAGLEQARGDAPAPADARLDDLQARLLDAVRDYRAEDFDRALGLAMATVDMPRLATDVLAPLLAAVGTLWERGELSIAQERMVSSVLKTRTLALVNQRPRPGPPQLLLATLSGERHELGLLLVALLALAAGVPLQYLGADLPAAETAHLAERLGARLVAVSVVGTEALEDQRAQLAELRARLPDRIELWVGGAGAQALGAALPEGVRAVPDLAAADLALRELGRYAKD